MSGLSQNGNYVHELFQDIAKCLKEANRLPSQQDFQYFLNFPEFEIAISAEQEKVLNLFNKLSGFFGTPLKSFKDISKTSKQCLETVKSNLETIKCPQGLQESLTFTIKKPQILFPNPPDNSFSSHVPTILHKKHGKQDVPLGVLKAQQLKLLNFRAEKIDHYEDITHPYSFELESLVYFPEQFVPENSQFSAVENTPFELIDSPEGLDRVIEELKDCTELAVDLENHSIRSYLGLSCLIKISSRFKDYVIDALALREKAADLEELFANPEIVKVMHSSDSNIEYLQRDYSLYVVNLFDTALAAKELKYASCSLNLLLKSFCDVDLDKRYQQADWRLRPLPSDMVKYARCGTHFLLYIYDRLREELISKSLASGSEKAACLKSVLEASKKVCLKMYQKPVVAKDRGKGDFHRLCKARDLIARLEDESAEFVFPNSLLLAIASEKPNSVEQLVSMAENSYLEKYGKYIVSILRSNKEQETFSNDFFKDAGWVDSEKLPFSDVYEKMKKSDYGYDDVLNDISEILNGFTGNNEPVDEGKGFKNLETLLENSEVNENLIPKNLGEIFELSNNSRKKNKNKCKAQAEVVSPEKVTTVNLQKVLRDIGWE